MNTINTLRNFAISFNYPNHHYLAVATNHYLSVDAETKELVQSQKGNAKLEEVLNIIEGALKESGAWGTMKTEKLAVTAEALKIIRSRLETKSSNIFNRIFFPKYTARLKSEIERINQDIASIDQDLARLDTEKPGESMEESYFVHFLASLPETLKVKYAPKIAAEFKYKWKDEPEPETKIVNEQAAIKWLSKSVYESEEVQNLPLARRQERYMEIMSGAYRGDHLLIEDDEAHHHTQELVDCGAIIRGSSHYEKGLQIVDWVNGEPKYLKKDSELHASIKAAKVNHYGLTGKHIKHILFNAVDMRETEDGELIPAMTAKQADELATLNKLKLHGKIITKDKLRKKDRPFTAFQFEYSIDSEGNNFKDPNFYTHRLTCFILYRVLKKLGIKNANIGAYGYGRTDMNPLVLKKADAFKTVVPNAL